MTWIDGAGCEIEVPGTKLTARAAGAFLGASYVCIQIFGDEPKVDWNLGHIHVRSKDDRRKLAAVLLTGIEDDRVARALALLDTHRQSGSRMETECMCAACQMGRILRWEELRT